MSDATEEVLERRAARLLEARDRLLEELVNLRKYHQLTQQDVAERMNVSQPTVAAFERYDANPTLASIVRYAMAVDATLRLEVEDDCGVGVPANWQKEGAARATMKAQRHQRRPAVVGAGWAVVKEVDCG